VLAAGDSRKHFAIRSMCKRRKRTVQAAGPADSHACCNAGKLSPLLNSARVLAAGVSLRRRLRTRALP
jgi:hypothetical protein